MSDLDELFRRELALSSEEDFAERLAEVRKKLHDIARRSRSRNKKFEADQLDLPFGIDGGKR
jgi:hypothetical protein